MEIGPGIRECTVTDIKRVKGIEVSLVRALIKELVAIDVFAVAMSHGRLNSLRNQQETWSMMTARQSLCTQHRGGVGNCCGNAIEVNRFRVADFKCNFVFAAFADDEETMCTE